MIRKKRGLVGISYLAIVLIIIATIILVLISYGIISGKLQDMAAYFKSLWRFRR